METQGGMWLWYEGERNAVENGCVRWQWTRQQRVQATDKRAAHPGGASRAIQLSPTLRGAERFPACLCILGSCSHDDPHLFSNTDHRGGSNRKTQCQRHIAQGGVRRGAIEDFNTNQHTQSLPRVVGLQNTLSFSLNQQQ